MPRKNTRRIGKKNEIELAKVFTAWCGFEFHSTPASGGLHWKKDSRVSGDLVPDAKHSRRFPFSIEAKRDNSIKLEDFFLAREKSPAVKAWRQACRDAKSVKKIPLLCYRTSGLPKGFYFVVMEISVAREIINYWSNDRDIVNSARIMDLHLGIMPISELTSMDYKEVRNSLGNL